jgi:hypothetical protein
MSNTHREVIQQALEAFAHLVRAEVLEEAAIALRNHGTYLDASEAAEIVEALKGWKTLIPTEGCLNCERQPKAEQEPVLYVHPSTYAMESANQIGVWRPGCQLDDYLPLYFAPPAPQPRKRLTDQEITLAMMRVEEQEQGYFLRLARAIEAAVWGEKT